jgi:hypothetical protein
MSNAEDLFKVFNCKSSAIQGKSIAVVKIFGYVGIFLGEMGQSINFVAFFAKMLSVWEEKALQGGAYRAHEENFMVFFHSIKSKK